jgi:hypothetical protein
MCSSGTLFTVDESVEQTISEELDEDFDSIPETDIHP